MREINRFYAFLSLPAALRIYIYLCIPHAAAAAVPLPESSLA